MKQQTLTIAVRDSLTVTAVRATPEGVAPGRLFIYAPGAGSNLHDPFGTYLTQLLAGHGIEAWRFQFPYMEAGRRSPDATSVLEATWNAIISEARADSSAEIRIGGRSMGGRIASLVVVGGAPVTGLALFAYPLVPPGHATTADRSSHLTKLRVPTLFCSGTRDSFATPDQIKAVASSVPGSSVHLLEGADHGFSVLKASTRTHEDVWQEAGQALLSFLDHLPGGASDA